MTADKIVRYAAILGVLVVILASGCAQQSEQTVVLTEESKQAVPKAQKPSAEAVVAPSGSIKIALKPAPGDQASYKIATRASRSIEWEGPVPEKQAFEGSQNDQQVEMVITRYIENVDANGRIRAKVTINKLKCLSVVKNQTVVDFDSERESDVNSPLNKIIGQGYTMEFGPDNYVSSVSNLPSGQSLMSGRTSADRMGQNLLSADAIKQMYTTLLLPQAGAEYLKPSGTWNRIKTFQFGLMGLKSYEKIYTLKEIRDARGHQIAVIDLKAIPSSEVEPQYRDKKAGMNFPNMFDTNDTYTGDAEIDLTAGRIDKYHEALRANWVTAMPANQGADGSSDEPVVLKMSATRDYSLEKIK